VSNVPVRGLRSSGSDNALELRGVARFFGALAALSDITLSVRPGERRAVLGSNGAGKTTLFNCITGDFPPSSGIIRFFGEDVTTFPPQERIRRGLRRTYQISSLFTGLSVNSPMGSSASSRSRSRCRERRASSSSTSRPPACHRRSGATSSTSSPRCPSISATSSSSTTWTWLCVSSRR
jgi:branched-chain amino acid transport system ATP-binding protein